MLQSGTRWCPFCRVGMLLTVLLVSGAGNRARAALITFQSVVFTAPVFQFSGTNDAIVGTIDAGQYSFSGEFCVNEDCSGGPVPTVDDSLLRLTNLTLTCTNPAFSGFCGPIDVLFQANDESSLISSGAIDVELNGSGTASGYARACLADSVNICASDLTGPESVTVPFTNAISGGNQISSVPFSPGFMLLGDFHLNGLQQNSSVTLSSSLDIGLVDKGSTATPEPSSAWLVSLGATLLFVWRKIASCPSVPELGGSRL